MRPLLTLIALVCLAAPAEAASVHVSDPFVHFRAAAGERNRLDVRTLGKTVMLTDAGARLRSGEGCHPLDAHRVRCRLVHADLLPSLLVSLGDRDDVLRVDGAARVDVVARGESGGDVLLGGHNANELRGGPGADVLVGHGGEDILRGGAGDDELTGGAGIDVLSDGAGHDVLRAGPGRDELRSTDQGTRDEFFGGANRDRLSYVGRRTAVRAELSSGAGEDDIAGIENLSGGAGDDDLRGDGGKNAIVGHRGFDEIRGNGGVDRLFASGGDEVRCGGGDDVAVLDRKGRSLIRPDCESVSAFAQLLNAAQPVRVDADSVTFEVPCAAAGSAPAEITLRTPAAAHPWFEGGPFDTLVASGSQPVGATVTCETTLALTAAGRALPRPIPVTLTVPDAAWTVLLAKPPATTR